MKYQDTESVEHRYSERVPLRQDVWIMHGGRKLGPYRTRNVCRDGIFIEHHDAELYPNDMLKVVLCADKNENSQEPIDVIVTHRSSDGIGVLASKYHVDLQKSLQISEDAIKETIHKSFLADKDHEKKLLLGRSRHKINPTDEAEVLVSKDDISSQVTVTVRAGRVLDLRAVELMRHASIFAKRYNAAGITVDLSRTDRIQDSGLAMLLLLKKNLGQRIRNIKLINTDHLSHSHLAYLPISFEIN